MHNRIVSAAYQGRERSHATAYRTMRWWAYTTCIYLGNLPKNRSISASRARICAGRINSFPGMLSQQWGQMCYSWSRNAKRTRSMNSAVWHSEGHPLIYDPHRPQAVSVSEPWTLNWVKGTGTSPKTQGAFVTCVIITIIMLEHEKMKPEYGRSSILTRV